MRQINCRFCGGAREVTRSGICTGCGSDEQQASEPRTADRRKCPKCSDGILMRQTVGHIWNCVTCGFSLTNADQLDFGNKKTAPLTRTSRSA